MALFFNLKREMTDNPQNPRPPVYIVHERFYVTNISQIPVPTYDDMSHITQNIIHLARGPRVLYNVFTLYHGDKGIVSALHKIAEALKPGKYEPWYPLVPGQCLTLYEMPNDYTLSYTIHHNIVPDILDGTYFC